MKHGDAERQISMQCMLWVLCGFIFGKDKVALNAWDYLIITIVLCCHYN